MTDHAPRRRGYRGEHRGFKIATASERRYLVVYYRDEERIDPRDGFVYRRVAEVVLRTDNLTTARRKRDRIGFGRADGLRAFIVDTVDGEENPHV